MGDLGGDGRGSPWQVTSRGREQPDQFGCGDTPNPDGNGSGSGGGLGLQQRGCGYFFPWEDEF